MMRSKPPPRKSVLHRLGWIVLAVLGVVGAAIISTRFLPGSGTERHLRMVREAGLPTTLDELNRWLPSVAPSNNAALLVLDAIDKRVAPSRAVDDLLPMLSPGMDFAEAKEDFERYVEKNKEALELVHRAAALPAARYPINLTNTFTVQHLADVKGLANLLKAEAVYYFDRGESNLAFRSVTSGFALARTLRDEPALINELVRIAFVAIALSNLEQLLAAQKLSADQLATVNEMLALAEGDAERGAFHSLVTERAILLHYFDLPSGEFMKSFSANPEGNEIGERLKLAAYRVFGVRDRDQSLFLEFMDKLSRAATNQFPDALRLAGEVDREMDRRLARGFGRFAIISPVLHSMHKVVEKEAAILTRLRCARTAIAVERYRRDQEGNLPASLGNLVPTYLSEMPRDPAVGQPLQFEQNKTAYHVSSPAAAARLKNPRTATFRIVK